MVATIKHPNTYQCEVCKTQYADLWRAQLCESFPVVVPTYKKGDCITVQTKYEGVVNALVTGTRLTNHLTWVLHNGQDPRKVKEYLEKTAKEDPLYVQHSYEVLISEGLEIGKDNYTDVIPLEHIVS